MKVSDRYRAIPDKEMVDATHTPICVHQEFVLLEERYGKIGMQNELRASILRVLRPARTSAASAPNPLPEAHYVGTATIRASQQCQEISKTSYRFELALVHGEQRKVSMFLAWQSYNS
ncbi:hypothetical protein [Bifidobacterium aquikefiricola]|uniref:Uncharacterized protein n=1 Tax=Bifidobacterium aquikefiricola TaxID=3059038 RepID=A0AB39U8W0_9BIFI